jgi:Ca2+-binding EF-hand superfamily protein
MNSYLRASLGALTLLGLASCAANSNQGQSAGLPQTNGNDIFAMADANHDGKLSREEAGDYVVYLVFAARDTNHDNQLTLAEWTRGDNSKVAAFEERDSNRDGVVTLEEAIVYGRQGGAGLSLMRKADKNHDGKLDRAELQAYYSTHDGS